MSENLLDKQFQKYATYANNLIYKDASEAIKYETSTSKERYKVFLSTLNDKNYFVLLQKENFTKAQEVFDTHYANYVEMNAYYIALEAMTGKDIVTLRTAKHLAIVGSYSTEDDSLSSLEKSEFNKIYNEELDYYNTAQYRYDFQDYTLFNKLAYIFILFATIMRIMKNSAFKSLNNQDIEEYYLNNFLVSHGFLLYNNINYTKKKRFIKYIVELYNNKGSLQTIKTIIDLLHGEADIYEYYLFYDEDYDKYQFLRVKPDETFINILNTFKADRVDDFDMVTAKDDSWKATEEDLKEKNIKFIKSKYFSIESYSDISTASREVSMLINQVRRYRETLFSKLLATEETFNKVYSLDVDELGVKVRVTDFLMFLSLLAMRMNSFSITDISYLSANEDVLKYNKIPSVWEYQKYNVDINNTLSDITKDTVKHQNRANQIYDDIYTYKNDKKFTRKIGEGEGAKEYNNYDYISALKKELNNDFSGRYRSAITNEKDTPYSYDHLIATYPSMEKYLTETDISVLSKQFTTFLDILEAFLVVNGQLTFKFKDIYSNLYLPKVIEIIKYFKSMNAYLLDFNNTIMIEKENKADIISDSDNVGGLIQITNRDKGGNAYNEPAFNPDTWFDDTLIKDKEVDLGKEIINTSKITDNESSLGKTTTSSTDGKTLHDNTVLYNIPMNSYNRKDLIYSSFTEYVPYITDFSQMIDTDERLDAIMKDKDKFYLNGQIIDFYGSQGSFQELREKYNLSYEEFRDKVTTLLSKYNSLFGYVTSRLGIEKKDYLFTKKSNKQLAFLKKPYLFQRVQNKVQPGDILYTDLKNRGTFTDALAVYKKNLETNKWEYKSIYTDKYRSLVRVMSESDKFNEHYTGIRHYKELIEQLKSSKSNDENEVKLMGEPPTPGYNIFLFNGKKDSNILQFNELVDDNLIINALLSGVGIPKNTRIKDTYKTDRNLTNKQIRITKNLTDNIENESVYINIKDLG